MRKQYHFWPAEDGDGFDTAYWFAAGAQIPTVRRVVEHARLILEADRSYPILLGHEGRVMDGMHRVGPRPPGGQGGHRRDPLPVATGTGPPRVPFAGLDAVTRLGRGACPPVDSVGDAGPVSSPVIRRALPGDATEVRTVIERAIRGSAAGLYPPRALEAWASGRTVGAVRRMIEGTAGFVANVERALVGWANLDGNEVDQLYVEPQAGGRGVARRLYEALERQARANGLEGLTAVASLRAEPAFRRFGFHELGRDELFFNGQTFTVVRMTKNLGVAAGR